MEKKPPNGHPPIKDYGTQPFAFNVRHAASENTNFRTALWTGQHMQLTLMCIPVGEDIGVEKHPDDDQMLVVEKGRAKLCVGACRDAMREKKIVGEHDAVLIPAGTWHNLINVGDVPLKLWSVYAPPHHPFGTVHRCKADAT